MSAAAKKVFRIERAGSAPAETGDAIPDSLAEERHQEIMTALRDLRQSAGGDDGQAERDEHTAKMIDDYKNDLMEANKLKGELHRIYAAISQTKQEIATIH